VTHQAQKFINEILYSGNLSNIQYIEGYQLTQTDVKMLLRYLEDDAKSYLYSSIVSVADAISGINEKFLTWATVKLYYATFYALRSLLAMNGVCIFYIKKSSTRSTPFILTAQIGQKATKGDGTTHKLVLNTFSSLNVEPRLLSQQIGLEQPLEWLMNKREEANYKIPKFPEPEVPKHFEKVVTFGVRKVVKDYLSDTLDLYLFDPDHAILAYPLTVIQLACNKVSNSGTTFTRNDITYLCNLFKDKQGKIPDIYNLLKLLKK